MKRVANLYGPTEDTTYSTVAWLAPAEPAPPPIGHPFPAPRPTSSTTGWAPCPPRRWVSCTWAGRAWPGATTAAQH